MRCFALFCSLLLFVGACSGTSEDTTTSSEDLLTTTSVDPPGEDEGALSIAVATSAVDAWNSLDYATFRAVFVDSGVYDGYPIDSPATESEIDFWMGLGGRVAVSECTEIDTSMVACLVSGFDDLGGAVGHGFESRISMRVAGEQLSEFEWWPIDASKIDYTAAMVAWVRDAHPDVFAETFADESCGNFARLDCWGDWAASAAAAEALLGLHTEYEAWLASASGQPPAISDAALETARTVVDHLNAYDAAALTGIAEGGTTRISVGRSPAGGAPSLDVLPRYMAIEEALGSTWSLGECIPGRDAGSVECEVTVTHPVREALGLAPLSMELKAGVDGDGAASKVILLWTSDTYTYFGYDWENDFAEFLAWVEGQQPEIMDDLLSDTTYGGRVPASTSGAMWADLVTGYLASLEG